MRRGQRFSALILCLTLFLCSPINVFAETSLEVFGVGAIEEDNLAKAEQSALSDAFSKALLLVALRYVPNTSSFDLAGILPDYMASRGMQDIIQYQINSRIRQYDILALSVDIKLDEESLRDWLYSRTLTVPYELRPKVLLMISSYGPGEEDLHEWWNMKGKKTYSSFETELSGDLMQLGESVLEVPRKTRSILGGTREDIEIAEASGADLLLSGTITYTPVLDTLYECSIDLNLIDIDTSTLLGSWSVSHRGDFALDTMNSIMSDEVIKPIRSRIAHKMLSSSPVVMKKILCIEGIREYVTYQAFINALRSMDSMVSTQITGIKGHTICHNIRIKGSLFDIMENLKREQITEADILVEDETAYIRIIDK
ncbi:MAG: hypothetical protein JXM72_00315 [Deltaproteobacteria bacterium]|nr:hypothetical protein [Deltaproteobacteria bacterium]